MLGVPNRQAGKQHGAAGNADCTGPGALIECMRKYRASFRKSIQIGGVNFVVIKAPDRSMGLIIHEDYQYVGALDVLRIG